MRHALARVAVLLFLIGSTVLASDDLSALAGKWTVKKVNDEGKSYAQTIEVRNDKFIFEIVGSEDRVILHAEGDLKLEKLGPFTSAKFCHIRAGGSASDLQDIDDEYVSVYLLDADTWTMAANFDKQRDRQKASLDVYKRTKAGGPKPATKSDPLSSDLVQFPSQAYQLLRLVLVAR